MERISIDLPDEALDWARAQVEAGEAENLGEYFRGLAERDRQKVAAVERLDALLRAGLESGVDPRSHNEIFDNLTARYDL